MKKCLLACALLLCTLSALAQYRGEDNRSSGGQNPLLGRRAARARANADRPVGALGSFVDRTQWIGGLSLEFVPVRTPLGGSAFNFSPLFYGFNIGFSYTLAKSSDNLAITLDPSLTFSWAYSSYGGSNLFLQVPAYVMARAGANATQYSEGVIGVGLGVGGSFTYTLIPYEGITGNTIVLSRFNAAYFSPAAVGEVSINTQTGTRMALRFHINLLQGNGKTEQAGFEGINFKFENYGFGLLYYF